MIHETSPKAFMESYSSIYLNIDKLICLFLFCLFCHISMSLYDPQVLAPQMRSNDYVTVSLLGLMLHLCKSDINYALERYAWQKDIWANVAFPSRAVDGNSDPAWYGNSCAMTASEQKPWWAVDLGQIIHLSKIVVTNRIENRKTS